MLTIYEQVQGAIDLVEADLGSEITAARAARSAGMSLRSFHRYFPALTGYRFGEYVRRRRLTLAMTRLLDTDATVLRIAIDSGYESHEAFTRAFKSEAGVTPSEFRTAPLPVRQVRAIDLVGEVQMGVLTKRIPTMKAVVFDGYQPDPEMTAHGKMEAWLADHPEVAAEHRVFGHNIDASGKLSHEPDNEGYRVLVSVPESVLPFDDGTEVQTIPGGEFVVTGIEGSFEEDPTGAWITEGWMRLNEMVKRNDIELDPAHRWFEELLEPVEPGNTRFDLYVELRSPEQSWHGAAV